MQRPWCRVVGDASGRIIKATEGFDLERFVTAQEPVFDAALSELRAGRKRPLDVVRLPPNPGLGSSSMAEYYGIGSLAEARAYLAHPVLGLAHGSISASG